MSRVAALLTLIAVAPQAFAVEKPHCDPIDETIRLPGPNLSLAELERIGLARARTNPAAPQVTWAYGHDDWLLLKAMYRPGDQIRAYEQRWCPGGKPFSWGYALVRGQCVLGSLATGMS